MNNEILICESKDSGTPLIGGKNYIESFHYGKNSYKKHTEMLNNENFNYKKVFHKELSFEVDELEDYNKWFKSQEPWLKQNADYLTEVPTKLREVASITLGIENPLDLNVPKGSKISLSLIHISEPTRLRRI